MNAFAKRALFSYGSVTQTKADTADSHELVKLLFQGLTDRVAAARNALERDDKMERANCVTRAQKILFGLRQTLDFEQGGELARNLDSLYDYCTRRLTEGHAREDVGLLARLENHVDAQIGPSAVEIDGPADQRRAVKMQAHANCHVAILRSPLAVKSDNSVLFTALHDRQR